jgi:polyisoprenoid-binding protein YceI
MRGKMISLLFIVSLCQLASAQKYITKTGHIWFYSHTPMEDIEAHNRQVVSSLDESTGDVVFLLLIKSFEFKTALMQEHFNENYMESDKIPKANFKGKITNLKQVDFRKDGTYPAEVSGDLTIHGATKTVSYKGTIEIKGKTITANAKFMIIPQDYGIKIPSLVENKIAKEIPVTVETAYNPE